MIAVGLVKTVSMADYLALLQVAAEVARLVHSVGLDEPIVNERRALEAARVLSRGVLRRLSDMEMREESRPDV